MSSEGIHWFDSTESTQGHVLSRSGLNFDRGDRRRSPQGFLRTNGDLQQERPASRISSIWANAIATTCNTVLESLQADIKYAIIYTNDAFLNSSPFGRFDNLNYSFPEFQSISNAQGGYAIEELPKGNYVVQAAGGPAGKIPIGAGAHPLTVAQADHLSQADFGFRNNLPPVIQTSSLSIPENPEVGTEVGQVVASDPDSGQTLTYQFMNFAGPFAIDSATGVVTVANAGTGILKQLHRWRS